MKTEKFKSLNEMLFWVVGLMLVLMCSRGQAQGTFDITMKDRVLVVMSGQKAKLEFTVTTPANQSNTAGSCLDPEGKPIFPFSVPSHSRREQVVVRQARIAFENSGQYTCKLKQSQAYFSVLVKAKPYMQPKEPLLGMDIGLWSLNSVLLIFTVLGSIYIFKGHGCQWKAGDKRHSRNVQSAEDQVQEERIRGSGVQTVRNELSTSVYASLEPQPKAIYEVLHPARAANFGSQKEKVNKMFKLVEQNAEEGVDGDYCVYENF